jgi:hypothetical protein
MVLICNKKDELAGYGASLIQEDETSTATGYHLVFVVASSDTWEMIDSSSSAR